MKILAIETATRAGSVALLDADRVTGQILLNIELTHSERLMAMIDRLLADCGVGAGDLQGLAVSVGPGSFTGLRIGLSAARGVGLARHIPVIGVPSLLAISLGHPTPVAVLLDARRGEAYVQLFPEDPEPQVLPIEAARARIPAGVPVIDSPFCDIALVAKYAGTAPAGAPPEATYVRDADAKPQEKFRVARQ